MTNYTKWKNWDVEKFGFTSKENSLYYQKLFSKKLPDIKKVLEIGFGNGTFLNWCKENHLNISGVEQDNDLLNRAKKQGYKAYKSISQIKGVKFDLIVLFDVLEHVPEKNIQSLFESLKKILAKNGEVFIRVPNGSSPFGLTYQHGDVTHVTTITGAKLVYWAKFTNFKIIYCGADKKILHNGRLLKFPTRLIRRILHLIIEKIIRYIFSPLPRGILSANLLCILSHNELSKKS